MEKVYPEVSPWSTASAPIGLIPPPPDDYIDDGDYDCNFILVLRLILTKATPLMDEALSRPNAV